MLGAKGLGGCVGGWVGGWVGELPRVFHLGEVEGGGCRFEEGGGYFVHLVLRGCGGWVGG